MRFLRGASLVFVASAATTGVASAQNLRGFISGGLTTNVNHETFPGFGGGVVIDVGQRWVAAGVEGETFFSWPYFAGRATVFGQAHVLPKGTFRPFILGGFGWGEEGGPMFGGGIDIRPHDRGIGFRATVEDYVVYVNGYDRNYYGHQVALRFGLSFR